MDYVDLVEKMEGFQEAEILKLDQEVNEELWEFYGLRSTGSGDIREYIGKGDDPVEAYNDAKDNGREIPSQWKR